MQPSFGNSLPFESENHEVNAASLSLARPHHCHRSFNPSPGLYSESTCPARGRYVTCGFGQMIFQIMSSGVLFGYSGQEHGKPTYIPIWALWRVAHEISFQS